MSIDTDLNQYPYFDDFNSNNQFYRILHRPTAPIQIREVNQTQTMAQYQIEKFGKNIFVDGSIVDGCKITFNSSLPYVKILDSYANSSAFTISNFKGSYVQSTNGLRAYITDTYAGYVSQAPDLNTLYVNYLNSSNDTTIKTFQENEVLTIYNAANVAVGSITVANSSISGANSAATGVGYSLSVSDGTIFHKGYFLDVQKQSMIVSKYNNTPDQISIGFNTVETIVTPEENSSLLDNSAGSPNYAGPGAHRLQLTPTLIERATSSSSTNNFFSIVDFVGGNPAIIRQASDYATIGDAMAQISDDTSGNFIISPFNLRCTTLYQPDGVTPNTSYVKLSIDPGSAYVHGYKVQTNGMLVNKVRKGNDVAQAASQTITTTLGNYLIVNEFAGAFNPTIGQSVQLRSATSHGISLNLAKGIGVGSISAAGSLLGTATVIGVEYYSGVPGTPSAQYLVFLTNIVLQSGANFQSVRSIYVSGGVSDVILDVNGNCTLNESTLGCLVYPFNQSAIKTLKDATNTTSGQFDFNVDTSISFNTSGQATVTIPTYVGGVNALPFGTGTLSAVQVQSDFIITNSTTTSLSAAAGTVTLANTTTTTVSGLSTAFNTAYIVGDYIQIGNSTVTDIRQITAIANSTSLSVSSPTTYAWTTAAHNQVYVAGQHFPNPSITINSSTSFTINLGITTASAFNANIIYPVQRSSASPALKTLNNLTWVTIDCSTHPNGATGPWCLGIPDVQNAVVFAGTSYSNTNLNVSSLMQLDNGQRDTYYGLASLYNHGATITSSTKLLVGVTSYSMSTSAGIGFFSVDSYPVDDTGVTANTIYTKNIPLYTSPSTGATYPLRNCVDFRLFTQNTIPYAANLAAVIATPSTVLNPANTLTFINNGYIPVIDSPFQSAVQYYLGRYDKVGFTPKGSVVIIEGTPAENPVPPSDITAGITLATVSVPPYPTLTVDDTTTGIVTFQYNSNKRYTMKDIGGLDARLKQVEYYTSLSSLELSAKNLMITNSSGQNRMQNGILADPFQNFTICNTSDINFNIAIDSANCEARPIFNQQLVHLQYNKINGDNCSVSSDGRIVSLTANQNSSPFIAQPFASETMNAAQDSLYVWSGTITLNPTGDYQPDVTVNPDVVVTDNSYSNFSNISNAWPTQWGNWQETSSSASTSTSQQYIKAGAVSLSNLITGTYNGSPLIVSEGNPNISQAFTAYANATVSTTTVNNNYVQYGTKYGVTAANNSYNLGTYVTNVSIQPYCQAKLIKFIATGLKPNTRLYAWMDDTNVSADCVLTDSNFNIKAGQNLVTDSTGTIYGMFYLPAATFRSGNRTFNLCDVNNMVTLSNAITTTASATYYGTNIAYAENNVTLNTITPQIVATKVSNTMTTSSTTSTIQGVSNYIVDPLAQGITITNEVFGSNDIQGVFVSSVDLFFESVDPILGVTVMIRDMQNGYPGATIQNFSQVHLTPSQINVSSDSSVATNVQFEAPVLLQTGTQYCIVIMPDGSNPNYNLWVAELGKTDTISGSPIYSLTGTGDLFTSSQNTTWTADQTKRLKFNLYTYAFTALNGTAQLVNDNTEYFTITNTNGGSFQLGEAVYPVANDVVTTGATTSGNTIITVPNSGLFTANSKIVLRNSATSQAFVANVNSILTGTTFSINTAPTFTSSTVAIGNIIGNTGLTGIVSIANSSSLYITNSTANSTIQFSNNMYLIGSTSGAYANTVTLNDIYYGELMPKLAVTAMNDTALTYNLIGTSNSATSYVTDTTSTGLSFGVSTPFIDQERVVMSRSNELIYKNGNKSLVINASFVSQTSLISPIIDTAKLGAVCLHTVINAEDANNDVYTSELNNNGQAVNRYISQTVTLTTGMDAEDLIVYLGAYWPTGTQIYVYGKFLNQYDSDPFNNKLWTPMNTTNTVRSSTVNKQDTKEYIFTLPVTAPSPSNATAYLDPANTSILTYVANTGQVYTTYSTFAVKVVLLSNAGSYLYPRLSDLRAIATPSSA